LGHLLKNSFYSTVTLGFRFISNAILFIVIARYMGVEEFGRFAFAVSFTGIFLVIVDYGFCLQIVRDVAVMPENALLLSTSMLNGKLLLSFISTVVIVISINILNYPTETKLIVYILWLAFLFYSFGLFFNSIFRGLNKFQYETYPTIVLNVIQFVLVLLLLVLNYNTLSVALVYLASRIVYFLFSIYLVHKKIGNLAFCFDMRQAFNALKKSLPYGIHTILATLYFQLDTVFISFFNGNTEVGHYQAAMRIVLAFMIICEVITSSYFPLIARDYRNDMISFKNTGLDFNKYLILSGGAILSGLILFADILIRGIYGSGYESSVIIMQLLSVVVFLRFAGGGYAAMITVSDNQNLRAFGVSVSLVVNVILNCILIPVYGAVGAAIASVLTHLVLVALYVLFSYKLTGEFLLSKDCRFGLMVLVVGYFACNLIKNFSPILSIFVFTLSIVTLGVKTLDFDKKQAIKQKVNRLWPRVV